MAKADGITSHGIARYADELLRIGEIADYAHALNGLQIENDARVTKIGTSVDASLETFRAAAQRGVDFLIVHHGMFWPGLRPIAGPTRELIKLAFENQIALYSAHIPLDVHPELGNNARLIGALGFNNTEPFFPWKNVLLGVRAQVEIGRDELVRRLAELLRGDVRMIAAGPAQVRSIGVITGGAGGEIFEVAKLGVDTFVTGEAPHWAAVAARDLGINLLVGGHYATETFGVRALAEHLAQRFSLPHEFIDCPTGF